MVVESVQMKTLVGVVVAIAIALVGYVDSIVGLVPDLTLLYLLPILAVVYVFGLWPGLATAGVAVVVEILVSPSVSTVSLPRGLVNAFLHFLVFALVVVGGDRLLHQLRAVRRLQELRATDMRLASEVQQGLAQSGGTSRQDIEMASRLRFMHEVGGDYFHFQDLGDTRSFFCIADISGSGMTAALFTSLLDQAVREELNRFRGLDALMARLNARIHEVVPTNMFVTMCCGVVGANDLSWINAGHEPLFLWRDKESRVDALLTEGAIPLGILADFPGRESTTPFAVRDLLLLVTDGVTESPRFIGDAFPRLAGVLADFGREGAGPDVVVDGVYRETLMGQADEIRDDIAILAISARDSTTAV